MAYFFPSGLRRIIYDFQTSKISKEISWSNIISKTVLLHPQWVTKIDIFSNRISLVQVSNPVSCKLITGAVNIYLYAYVGLLTPECPVSDCVCVCNIKSEY